MNLIKKAIFIVSLFCVAMPARAMNAGNPEIKLNVFDKIMIGAKVLTERGIRDNFITHSIFTCMGLSHTAEPKDCIWWIGWHINRLCYDRRAQKCQPWIAAARNPGLEFTKALLGKEGYLKEKDQDGKTPLHWAVSDNHEEKIKLLLAHGADIDAKDNAGRTVLHYAASDGYERLGMLLLKHGADVEARSLDGRTPLYVAVDSNQAGIVKLFLAHGADVNAKENSGSITNTALNSAVCNNNVEIAKLLLDYGANINVDIIAVWLGLEPYSPLLWAAKQGHIETVRCILQHAWFNPEKKSIDSASQARIKEALLVCMRNNLPRDVRNKIISYLPEDTFNQTHCRLALSYGADLNKLVVNCPLEWFLCMYDAIKPGHKTEFLNVIIPAITEYRMGKVRELLADPKLQELDPATTDPLILAMLDIANIEQHRAAITQNVRKAFTSRVLQKYQMDELNNVNQVVQDVMHNDLQHNHTRD